ncbi:VOC family protein [Ensifer canadensis]|uniref:VOC family protein n=1 Tax=Ensifer canadensis TaxID=555315 RepID=UPI001F243BEF|nr:VOC family protein [Ensifer canadensis]
MASVRYIVADVDEAVAFYRDNLEFKIDKHNPGKFAALLRDDLTLYLSAPGAGSGGQAGGDPKPGGWNRFMIITNEVDVLIERLRRTDARFRGEISDGGQAAPSYSKIRRATSSSYSSSRRTEPDVKLMAAGGCLRYVVCSWSWRVPPPTSGSRL